MTLFTRTVFLCNMYIYIYVDIFIIVFYLPYYCNIHVRYVVLSFDEIKTKEKRLKRKERFEISISKVKHLQSGNDNFLTLKDFASKHDLRVRPLSFYGLLSAVQRMLPILLRQKTITLKHRVKTELLKEKS